MDGISGDVSSTATDDEVPVPLADSELPLPNAWPPMGPTENDVAVLRQLLRVHEGRLFSRQALGGGANTGRSAIIFFESSTRDDDGDGGAGDAGHGDDVDDADAGAGDDDDAYGGFGFGFGFGAVPASGVAIACLPETTVGELGEGEARESGQCAVCLEEYEAGDALRTMPCAHGFHERCIFGWLRASRLCPLCRFALPSEEDDDTDTDVEVGRAEDDQAGEADDDDGSDGASETFEEHMFVT